MEARRFIAELRPLRLQLPFTKQSAARAQTLLPRTMAGWVGVGCILVAIPLLIALLLADVALDRLTRQAQLLTDESLRIAHLGTDLRDTFGNLERNARQYMALRDPALSEIVDMRLVSADRLLSQLQQHPSSEALGQQAALVRSSFDEARTVWKTQGDDLEGFADRLHTLVRQSSPITDMARAGVDTQMQSFHNEIASTRHIIGFSALTLIPLAALLALGFSVAVTHPLRRMARSIGEMGHGRYNQKVSIAFPHEMRRLGERLDWLRSRLALLDADKDRFLRHVSHELKTPLASLTEGAALLQEETLGRLTTRQAEVAQILVDSAQELKTLIDNLLTYAEWRRGSRQKDMAWFESAGLVEEVLATHRLPLSTRHLSAELKIQSRRLFGQRMQLRIALDNLLTNAIKHAPEASAIEIGIDIQEGLCQMWMRDQGRGVCNEDKQRIFEPFVRGAESEEAGRGTGIGLSIVQEVAQGHGGNAVVEDAHPGACFILRWPCQGH